MRPGVVMRAWVADSPEPVILQPLPSISLHPIEQGGVAVAVPAQDMEWIAPELRRRIVRFEVVTEWFLDHFAAGDETPGSVREELKGKEEEP
jgi:hypothetical protein